MHPLTIHALGALALVVAADGRLVAQSTFVSPSSVGTNEGSSSNSFPWTSAVTRRYMQIHSDLKGGGAKLIKQLAWRRDGAEQNGTGTRAVDLELYLGNSLDYDKCSYTISNNYKGTPTLAEARKVVNFGPLTSTSSPAAFEMAIPLGTMFLYTGVSSIAWEAVVYKNNLSGTFPGYMDVHASTMVSGAAMVTIGPGCIATGQTAAMTLGVTHADSGGIYLLGCWLNRGPASQPSVLAIGATNPNLVVPGLCGNLYTDLTAMIPVGSTDASGNLANSNDTTAAAPSMIFLAPNTFGGASLYLQAHSLNPGSSSTIPVVNSEGRSIVVPMPDRTRIVQASRLFNNAGGTTATDAYFFTTSSVGHSLVTEFTY